IPSTGGEARRIGNLPSPERSPVWSADSSHLRALTSMGGRILLVDHTAGEHDDQKTVMMPLLTGIDLASSSFALSPEGGRVVYLSGGGSGISLVKFGSSPGVTLFEGGIDTRPSYSKDGRQVVFGSNRGGAWDLITVGVSSGRTRKLTDTFERETDPDWR